MALKGNLRDFSLVQLLNLINLAKKTGALSLNGINQNAGLFFREGKLVYGFSGSEKIPLVRVLTKTKKLPASMAAVLGERYRNFSDQEFGLCLINAGYLTQEQIFQGIEMYLKDLVRGLFALKDGLFDFSINALPPAKVISVRIGLENLIIEGARLQNELDDLQNEIPSLEMALKFPERPKINLRDVSLNAEEWRVVSNVSPRNTIKQIAGSAQMNELQIRRVVLNLMQAGLVEMVRPVVSVQPTAVRMLPMKNTAEQRSLVNRVIDRIKSI